MDDENRADGVIRFLEAHGAATIPHPGGTLLAHLRRTADRLRDWGGDDDLATLGLAHAVYGTDGLDVRLLDPADPADRARVVALAGPAVEAEVYRYASCDRRATYPRLADRPAIRFTDRFADRERELPAGQLHRFAELTAANELDVALHQPGYQHTGWLLRLLDRAGDLLSPAARSDCHSFLAPPSTSP